MTDAPAGGRRRSRAAKVLIAAAALIAIVGIAGMYVKLPYVIFSPGDATPVGPYVHITGTRSYSHRGQVLLLTVRVTTGRPNLWRFVEASLDGDSRVIGEKQYLGNAPRGKVERQSVQLMDESQLAAKLAALDRLGYKVQVSGDGARVLQVIGKSPADRAGLEAGDVIKAIDGTRIKIRDQVGQMVQAQPVGTTFTVDLERDRKEQAVQVTSAAAPSGELSGKPYFGIGAETEGFKAKFPFPIAIDPGDVSGPSGGLAFTLTIIDDLTPGDLTGGRKVAVTGEIDSAGNVGEVGGVAQKAVAAHAAGATLMLVPVPEVKEARSRSGSMKVVGVKTLDQALAALARNGGQTLPARAAA
ncbi:MAG: PDZ domain-containing protein [Acidimicrobiia bacterium]